MFDHLKWSLFDFMLTVAQDDSFSFIGEFKARGLFSRGNTAVTILIITLFLAVVLLTVHSIQVRMRKKKEAERQKRLKEAIKKSWKEWK